MNRLNPEERFQIRAAFEKMDEACVVSFPDDDTAVVERRIAIEQGQGVSELFWTIYYRGIAGLAQAMIDCPSRAAANDVMRTILEQGDFSGSIARRAIRIGFQLNANRKADAANGEPLHPDTPDILLSLAELIEIDIRGRKQLETEGDEISYSEEICIAAAASPAQKDLLNPIKTFWTSNGAGSDDRLRLWARYSVDAACNDVEKTPNPPAI